MISGWPGQVDLASGHNVLKHLTHDLHERLNVSCGHLKLYLLLMILELQLLVLKPLLLAFLIYELKTFDDTFKASHLVGGSRANLLIL
jgi:hypothetical protein